MLSTEACEKSSLRRSDLNARIHHEKATHTHTHIDYCLCGDNACMHRSQTLLTSVIIVIVIIFVVVVFYVRMYKID